MDHEHIGLCKAFVIFYKILKVVFFNNNLIIFKIVNHHVKYPYKIISKFCNVKYSHIF
jgi:hypothetical protein